MWSDITIMIMKLVLDKRSCLIDFENARVLKLFEIGLQPVHLFYRWFNIGTEGKWTCHTTFPVGFLYKLFWT